MTKPIPSPEQTLHVLEILGKWTERGWMYAGMDWHDERQPEIHSAIRFQPGDFEPPLEAFGVDHFDALCQATTVMQILLEEHPAPDPKPTFLR